MAWEDLRRAADAYSQARDAIGRGEKPDIVVTLRRIAGNRQLLAKTYRADEQVAGATVAAAIPAFTKAVDKIAAALLADMAALPKQA